MKRKIVYTKFALKGFRLIAMACALVLSFSIVYTFHNDILPHLKTENTVSLYKLFYTCFDIIILGCCIFLIFFPQKFEVTSFISFSYSAMIIPFEPENYMGLLMFFLGLILLFVRGLMKKHTKCKLILLAILFLALQFCNIRFGLKSLIRYFIANTGAALVIAISVFLLYSYFQATLIKNEEKKLNLASYNRLRERDCRILKQIQSGTKYSTIAKGEGMSEGYLKNRLHLIFSELEVGDRQGFMTFYSNYEIFYIPETDVNDSE